jgi:hypothetical protein
VPEAFGDGGKRLAHIGGLEPDLRPCETQGRQTGHGVCLIAYAVLRLLRRRAVMAEAIGLDDDPRSGQ